MNLNHIRKNNLIKPPQNKSVVVGITLSFFFSQFMSQGCEEVLREGIFPRDFQHETQYKGQAPARELRPVLGLMLCESPGKMPLPVQVWWRNCFPTPSP
jgi:hypothetical protein